MRPLILVTISEVWRLQNGEVLMCFWESGQAVILLPLNDEREALRVLCRQKFHQQLPTESDAYTLALRGGDLVDCGDPNVIRRPPSTW